MARQEQRARIVLPVKVYGSNSRGEPLSETACLTDVSRNGARIEGVNCIQHVHQTITLEQNGNQVKFRVAWVGEPGTRLAGCAGLQSIEPMTSLFGIELPPAGPDSFDPNLPHSAPRTTSGVIDRRVVERRQQSERRRNPRYKCSGAVEIRLAGTQLVTWARASDICLGGCYVELSSPFPLDTPLELTVTIGDEKIHTRAVVRSHHPGFGMGLAFTETAPQEMEAVKRVVAILSGAAPALSSKVVPIATSAPRPPAAAVLDAVVKWFGTHETLSRTEFLRLLEKDVKKPTG